MMPRYRLNGISVAESLTVCSYASSLIEPLEFVKEIGVPMHDEETDPYRGYLSYISENHPTKRKIVAKIEGYDTIPVTANDKVITEAFMKHGVLVGGMTIYKSFLSFRGGDDIYNGCEGLNDPEEGGHAVVLLSYGRKNGVPYFQILNSHGPTFANNGRCLVHRFLFKTIHFMKEPFYKIEETDEASKKFSNAKSISSAQFSVHQNKDDVEASTTLQKFSLLWNLDGSKLNYKWKKIFSCQSGCISLDFSSLNKLPVST
ncbi:hypothetical protein LIER_41650 [Lithospermum erythrorhizon]|uniref:Peptidase C1A papain C-terminal domain-containing protein n=1 Tax=Lithospermum erythrorhizon TaxID=34254 RepID=A0AAV3RFQ9_LITER